MKEIIERNCLHRGGGGKLEIYEKFAILLNFLEIDPNSLSFNYMSKIH